MLNTPPGGTTTELLLDEDLLDKLEERIELLVVIALDELGRELLVVTTLDELGRELLVVTTLDELGRELLDGGRTDDELERGIEELVQAPVTPKGAGWLAQVALEIQLLLFS